MWCGCGAPASEEDRRARVKARARRKELRVVRVRLRNIHNSHKRPGYCPASGGVRKPNMPPLQHEDDGFCEL
jgi:hypothetical protein